MNIDIDKLEAMRVAATPGEWREVRGEIWGEELFAQYAVVAPTDDCGCRFEHGNASWLTAIHNAAPALFAEVRRLRAMLPKLLALLEVARKWEDGVASPMELALAVLDVDEPLHKKET